MTAAEGGSRTIYNCTVEEEVSNKFIGSGISEFKIDLWDSHSVRQLTQYSNVLQLFLSVLRGYSILKNRMGVFDDLQPHWFIKLPNNIRFFIFLFVILHILALLYVAYSHLTAKKSPDFKAKIK